MLAGWSCLHGEDGGLHGRGRVGECRKGGSVLGWEGDGRGACGEDEVGYGEAISEEEAAGLNALGDGFEGGEDVDSCLLDRGWIDEEHLAHGCFLHRIEEFDEGAFPPWGPGGHEVAGHAIGQHVGVSIEADGDGEIGEDGVDEGVGFGSLSWVDREEFFVCAGAGVDVGEEVSDLEGSVGCLDYRHVDCVPCGFGVGDVPDGGVARFLVGDTLAFEDPAGKLAEWADSDGRQLVRGSQGAPPELCRCRLHIRDSDWPRCELVRFGCGPVTSALPLRAIMSTSLRTPNSPGK